MMPQSPMRWFWLVMFVVAAWPSLVWADDDQAEVRPSPAETATVKPQPPAGRLIRVPLPLGNNADTEIKQTIGRALAELPKDGERPVLVLELVPQQNQFGEGTEFSRALDLARYLSSRELSGVKTVAFVPRSFKGHAVLVAMACEELVMAPDAELGEAGIDEPAAEALDPTVLAGYKQIAERRRTIPPPVALGMLDKDVEVLKVETETSPEYVLRSDLDELKKQHTIQSETVLKRPGSLGRFSGREGRELGFVKYLAADRASLAKALSMPAAALEDASAGDKWRPIHVRIKGVINTAQVSRVQRMIEDKLREGNVNFICITIDSPGGSLEDSLTLANFLAELDSSRVRTVAYIPQEALGDAALIPLACDQIVMNEGAVLGGSGAANLKSDNMQLVRETLRENLSRKKSRSWSLAAALLDPSVHIFRYQRQGDGLVEYYAPEEVQELPDAAQWVKGEEITRRGAPLRLYGKKAQEIGLVRHLAGDFHAFKQLYGLDQDPALVEPGWADYLIDKLASPHVGWLLLLIGMAALYAELQAPGIGIGGFVASVSFLLFFWNRFLEGTAGWLEVVLFAGGVCCVLLEIFVLPGVAIFGLGGGLLILASLILASQTFVWPHNEYQWNQLQDSMVSLFGVMVGLVAVVAIMRRYLPRTPWVSRMLLEPPSGQEQQKISDRESMVDFRYLVGQQGTTTTQLIPSGKARFENKLIDVIAEGEVIERGKPVVVTAVQGNRVVVKSVGGTG